MRCKNLSFNALNKEINTKRGPQAKVLRHAFALCPEMHEYDYYICVADGLIAIRIKRPLFCEVEILLGSDIMAEWKLNVYGVQMMGSTMSEW